MKELITIADYYNEVERVKAIIEKTDKHKGQWIKYLHKLYKEIQDYNKFMNKKVKKYEKISSRNNGNVATDR